MTPDTEPDTQTVPGEKNGGRERNRKYRMLAVDDERANLNLLRRTFRDEYELFLAEDGGKGLEILRRNPVDVIITDQRMPRMTGIQVLVESRTIVPNAIRIVLTAYADVNDIIQAINEGQIYNYVLKPWSPDELKRTVANAIREYELQRDNERLVGELSESLSQLKAAQQQLLERERLSTLGRVASSVIHDLKLPMSNIRTSAELLARENLKPDMREEFSQMIRREVDRLVGMTQEILEFSRGNLKLEKQPFQMEELLDEVFGAIQQEFTNSGIGLVKAWGELGKCVGDRERLRRVLLNLAMNARDAMGDRGELTFKAAPKKGMIVLKVRDTGPGIPGEILDRVFEPFVTHGKHNGTGLGLSIARNVVEAHQGTITVHNLDNGGAEFEITLPSLS